MNRWLLLGLLWMTGCGEAPAPQPAAASKPKPKPAAKPVPPPKFEVAADAFPNMPAAIEALVAAAEAQDSKQLQTPIAWLKLQGEASIAPLAEKLAADGTGVATRIAICRALGQLGPNAEKPLRGALTSEESLVRCNATEQLAILKPTNEQIVDTLITLLHDRDMLVRRKAASGLGHLGTKAAAATETLLAILNDTKESETIRSLAKDSLRKVNPRKTFQD